jgi:hypothetical protein
VSLVLIDTSVWIRGLHDRPRDADLRVRLGELLRDERVARHPFVYGELLVGDVGGGRQRMLSRYEQCPELRPVSHDAVVAFVQARRWTGRGLSWIDCHLLAAAVVHRVAVWATDDALRAAARDAACAFTEKEA